MIRLHLAVVCVGLAVTGAVTSGIAQQQVLPGKPVRPRGNTVRQEPNLWQSLEPLPAPSVPLDPGGEFVDVGQAANAVPVGAGDLDPTIDVQITQEIVDKAAELGTPAAMYEFVRNECAFQAYFGSQKGSVETLRQRAGNDYDLASLLIALLRASGIPARYAVGMVEMPAERARAWLGVDDAQVAGSILFTHGLEGINLVDGGGNVVAVRARRVWVEAFVSVGYGAPLWFPLDPAFKLHAITPGQDVPAAMGLDALALVDDYWDPLDPMVTLPRSETVLEHLEHELQDHLDAQQPGTTVDEVRRGAEIVAEELGLLPFSLPYLVRTRDTQYSALPSDRRYRLRFELYDGGTTLLDHTVDLPAVAGRRLTLDYVGATPADQAVIDANGGIYQTPPSAVDLTPVLRLEGAILATGTAGIGMGLVHGSDLHFLQPVNGAGLPVNVVPTIANVMIAGAAEAHAFSIEGVAEGLLVPPPADDTEGMAPLYWNIGMDYVGRVRASDLRLGGLLHGYVTTGVSNAIVSNVVKVTYDGFGVPQTFDWTGFVVDADRAVLGYWPVDGLQPSSAEPKDFLVIAGAEGSLFESLVYESDFEQDAVCTIKLLALAIDQGVTVHKRWSSLPLPANTQPAAVQNALASAILAGQEVTFPAAPMTLGTPGNGQWTGTAWIAMDPTNGAAGYIISGGANGGATYESWPPEFIDLSQDDRTVVQVEVLMRGLGAGDGIETSPVGDSPDPDAIFTRDMEQTLTFEYQVKVTYDDASTKTLPSDTTYYRRTTRNTTKTFFPSNYTFKVWIARRTWWFFTTTLAEAERNISIVGVLIREDDGSMLGKEPPKALCAKPPPMPPEPTPFVNVKALVLPEKAPDGTTDLATAFAWTVGPRLRWLMTTPGNQTVKLEPQDEMPSGAVDDQEVDVEVTLVGGKTVNGFAKLVFQQGGMDLEHAMTVYRVELEYDEDPDTYLPIQADEIQATATVAPAPPAGSKIRFELTGNEEAEFTDGTTAAKTLDLTGDMAAVDIRCKKYWSYAELQAELLPKDVVLDCKRKSEIPTDTDDDHIADAWEMMPLNGMTLGLGGNDMDGGWDEETSAGNANDGDGYTKLDEYKGVLIGPMIGPPVHQRLHANRKDVFFQFDAAPQGTAAEAGFAQLGVERFVFGGTNLQFLGAGSRTGIVIANAGTSSATNNGIVVQNGVATGNNAVLLGVTGGPRNGSASATIYTGTMSNVFTSNSIPETAMAAFNWQVPVSGGVQTYRAVYDGTDLNGDGDTLDQINPMDLIAPVVNPASPANNDAIDGISATMSLMDMMNRTTLHEAGHGVGIASSVNSLTHPSTGSSVMRSGWGPAKTGSFTATDTGQMKLR